jgi:hypothetical protein
LSPRKKKSTYRVPGSIDPQAIDPVPTHSRASRSGASHVRGKEVVRNCNVGSRKRRVHPIQRYPRQPRPPAALDVARPHCTVTVVAVEAGEATRVGVSGEQRSPARGVSSPTTCEPLSSTNRALKSAIRSATARVPAAAFRLLCGCLATELRSPGPKGSRTGNAFRLYGTWFAGQISSHFVSTFRLSHPNL